MLVFISAILVVLTALYLRVCFTVIFGRSETVFISDVVVYGINDKMC